MAYDGRCGLATNSKGNRNPKQLADICIKADYPGPFEFIFYCYYAFPTEYPEHIKKIFGRKFFLEIIEPEAIDEFTNTVHEYSIEAVVTFKKEFSVSYRKA